MYEYEDGWVSYQGGCVFRWLTRAGTNPHYCITTEWYEAPAIDGLEYV